MGNGTFTATASYSGRATGSKVTGYTSKAIYSGEVSKETLDSCTYKVIYEGAPIPAPYLQYGLTAGSVLALLIILAVLWNRRKNAKIYMKKYLTLLEDGMSSGEPELTKAHARLQAQISSRATPRFELFMGCLGNRIAVCNKAVEENGDYKMVAHISIEGNVIWCIAPGDAPAKDVIKIRHVADMERNRYEVWLSTLSEMERYA